MIDNLSAYSVLLVFLGLLFAHIEKSTAEFLIKEIPPEAQINRRKLLKREKKIQTFKCFASTLFSGVITYITIPDSIHIIKDIDI